MELFLDRSSPLHWAVVAVLALSSVLCAWVGVRDGFLREEMRTNAGRLTWRKARLAGALYVATALAGLAGAVGFLVRGR